MLKKLWNKIFGGKVIESYLCPILFFHYIRDENMAPGAQELWVDLSQYEDEGVAAYVVRGSPRNFVEAQKWMIEIGESVDAEDDEILLINENAWLDRIQYWGHQSWSWRLCENDNSRECEQED